MITTTEAKSANYLNNIDHALVIQKNAILRTLEEGTIESLLSAACQLKAVLPVWVATDYSYKAREIIIRIINDRLDHESGLHHRALSKKRMLEDIAVKTDAIFDSLNKYAREWDCN
jgi:hypothetical protein